MNRTALKRILADEGLLKAASRRKKKPTAAERAMVSAWKWGHITREELERRIGKARADEIAPRNR